MKTPTVVTRLLGTPIVGVFVFLACGVIVVGWMHGQLYWLWAFAALCLGGKTVGALLDLRRYKQWLAAWQAMNKAPAVAAPVRKASSSWMKVSAASLGLLLLPAFIAAPGTDSALRGALTLLWLGVVLYLLCKVAASLRRAHMRKDAGTLSAGENKKSAKADLVTWVLPRASSSPSRAEATRKLPAYCMRLMGSH